MVPEQTFKKKESPLKDSYLIDTHCHLDMEEFSDDVSAVLKRASQAGVKYLINVGSDLEGSRKGLDLSRRYEVVYAAVGIHPHDAKTYDKKIEDWLTDVIKKEDESAKKVVALGEVGLDYHYDHSPREIQKEVFKRQLQLALEHDLPVIIHTREAWEDTLKIVEDSGVRTGVFHCFSGDMDIAESVTNMGFFVSFAGPLTFKNAATLREVAAWLPDEVIMLETDAPYLSPVPYRGRRNEPSYIVETAKVLAKLRGVTLEDIARITSLNAWRLFGVGEYRDKGEIAYKIRENLYLNLTNRCSNVCGFCARFHTDYVKGHNLKLRREPELDELKNAIGDPKGYREVVFCGYGEPLLRLDLVKALARWIKERGGRVRINTNGHGNLIHRRNILPELRGIVDALSISLNAHDAETYERICKPVYKNAWEGVKEFIRESVKYIPEVTVTVVDLPGVDIGKCRQIAEDSGARFRVRRLNAVG